MISNTFSAHHSPHWFLTPEVFRPTREHGLGTIRRKIEEEGDRAREYTFIVHYRESYDEPYLPPNDSRPEYENRASAVG